MVIHKTEAIFKKSLDSKAKKAATFLFYPICSQYGSGGRGARMNIFFYAFPNIYVNEYYNAPKILLSPKEILICHS